jgi:hypothetical protein
VSAIWQDATGRTWSSAINVNTIKRVRDLVGVDLVDCFDGTLFNKLAEDPVLLVGTLHAICKPQAEGRGVSEEAFVELLVGDCITEAVNALVMGLVDFFPKERRGVLARLWATNQKARTAAAQMADRKMDSPLMEKILQEKISEMDAEIDQRLQDLLKSGSESSKFPA